MLLDFIRHIEDREEFYYWEKDQDFIKYRPYIIGHLFQLQRELEHSHNKMTVYCLLQKMFLMSPNFDLGLIKWLRTMVYNFIDEYSDLKIENAFEMFLMNDLEKYPTLKDYQEKCVAKMGIQAEGLAVYIAPVVLRMKLETVIVDKNAANGISKNLYRAQLGGKEFFEHESSLNFHNATLSLLLKPGHYDLLYPNTFIQQNSQVQQLDSYLKQIYKLLEQNLILSSDADFIKLSCCGSKFLKNAMNQIISEQFTPPYPQGFFRITEWDKKHASCLNPQCMRLLSYKDISQLFPGFSEEEYLKARNQYHGTTGFQEEKEVKVKEPQLNHPKFFQKDKALPREKTEPEQNKFKIHCTHNASKQQVARLEAITSVQQLIGWEKCATCRDSFSINDYYKILRFQPRRKDLVHFKQAQKDKKLSSSVHLNHQQMVISQSSKPNFGPQLSTSFYKKMPCITKDNQQIKDEDYQQVRYGCKCKHPNHSIKPNLVKDFEQLLQIKNWPRCKYCVVLLSPEQISKESELKIENIYAHYKANILIKESIHNSDCKDCEILSHALFDQIQEKNRKQGLFSCQSKQSLNLDWPACMKCKSLYSAETINRIFPWLRVKLLNEEKAKITEKATEDTSQQDISHIDYQESKVKQVKTSPESKMLSSVGLSLFSYEESNCECPKSQQSQLKELSGILKHSSAIPKLEWPKCQNCSKHLTPSDILKLKPDLSAESLRFFLQACLSRSTAKLKVCGHQFEKLKLLSQVERTPPSKQSKGFDIVDWPKCPDCPQYLDCDTIVSLLPWKSIYKLRETYKTFKKNKEQPIFNQNQSIKLKCNHSIPIKAMRDHWTRLFPGWQQDQEQLFKVEYQSKSALSLEKFKLRPICLECLTPLQVNQISEFMAHEAKKLAQFLKQNTQLAPLFCQEAGCEHKQISFQAERGRELSLKHYKHASCAGIQTGLGLKQNECVMCQHFKHNDKNLFVLPCGDKCHKHCFIEKFLDILASNQQNGIKIGRCSHLFRLKEDDINIFLIDAMNYSIPEQREKIIRNNSYVRKLAEEEFKLKLTNYH